MVRARWPVLILAILLGVCFTLQFFSARDWRMGGMEMRVKTALSLTGRTLLQVPPLGRLIADTHWSPVSFNVYLSQIDVDSLSVMIDGAVAGTFLPELEGRMRRMATTYALTLMLTAGISAVAAALMLNLRDTRMMVMAFAGGFLVVAVLASSVFATYDPAAFEEFELEGPVAAFPGAWEAVREGAEQLNTLRAQMRTLGSNLMQLYGAQASLPGVMSLDEENFTILVVADIHNHIAAVDFVAGMLASYPVRAVVDLGDLTDWGTPIEARIVGEIAALDIPYVFAAGNHETPDVVREMQGVPNVVILDGEVVIGGVRLFGYPDPSAHRDSPAEGSAEEMEALAGRYEEKAEQLVSGRDGSEVIVAVAHHPGAVARILDFPGLDIVLTAHTHRLNVQRSQSGALHLDPGSTGAAGVRGLLSHLDMPHTALLMHFSSGPEGTLLRAVDSVSLSQRRELLTIKREFYQPELVGEEPPLP